jgi:hypothetical protein
MALACDWWERWLVPNKERRVTGGSDQRATVFIQGGAADWAELEAWPPAASPVATFAATTRSTLIPAHRELPREEPRRSTVAPVERTSDPTAGALSGLWTLPISDFGYPLDQHDDDQRSLSFTSSPLQEPMLIAGQPTVALAVAPTATASRYVVKLTDVAPSGQSTVICIGLATAPQRREVEACGSLRLSVLLDPTYYEVPSGHHLRLVVSDSDFPRLWPSAGNECVAVHALEVGEGATAWAPASDADLPVTSISLPVSLGEKRGPAGLPVPPPNDARGTVKFMSRPVWQICRDHNNETLAVTLGASQPRLYTPDGERILVRDFAATAVVSRTDPAAATMTASGRFVIDTETGERVVVQTAIEVGDVGGTVRGEVLMDGKTVFARTWPRPR